MNRTSLSRLATCRTPSRSIDTGLRLWVRGAVSCRTFPLADPLPSTGSVAVWAALFARFFGTIRSSDSSKACESAVRRIAFSDRSSPPSGGDTFEVSRFPCTEFPRMLKVFDSVVPAVHSRVSRTDVWPSPYKYKVGTPD